MNGRSAERRRLEPRWARASVAGLLAAALISCGEGPTQPPIDPGPDPDPTVATVRVASALGDLIAVGRTAQLTAEALTSTGATVAGTASWSSSDDAIATVDANGIVTGVAEGTASISATVDGVTGSLDLTLADADLAAIETLLDDALAEELLGGVGGTAETNLRAEWAECRSGAGSGSLAQLRDCIATARTHLAGSIDPSVAPLAALLGLFVDGIERLLNLT